MAFNEEVATGNSPMLAGKVAIITGGANGIGRTAVDMFVKAGARVVTCDLDEAALEAVGRAHGDAVVTTRADMTVLDDLQRVVRLADDSFGRVDALYNNAGVGMLAPTVLRVHETPYEIFDRTLAINLRAVFAMTRETLPVMIRTGGSIINVASINALAAVPGSVSYISTKGAVLSMTRSIAFDYGHDGIRANALVPGYINTRMVTDYTDKAPDPISAEKEFADQHLLGRIGDPREVAAAAIWLASDASSFVTGSAFVVDGGYLAK